MYLNLELLCYLVIVGLGQFVSGADIQYGGYKISVVDLSKFRNLFRKLEPVEQCNRVWTAIHELWEPEKLADQPESGLFKELAGMMRNEGNKFLAGYLSECAGLLDASTDLAPIEVETPFVVSPTPGPEVHQDAPTKPEPVISEPENLTLAKMQIAQEALLKYEQKLRELKEVVNKGLMMVNGRVMPNGQGVDTINTELEMSLNKLNLCQNESDLLRFKVDACNSKLIAAQQKLGEAARNLL